MEMSRPRALFIEVSLSNGLAIAAPAARPAHGTPTSFLAEAADLGDPGQLSRIVRGAPVQALAGDVHQTAPEGDACGMLFAAKCFERAIVPWFAARATFSAGGVLHAGINARLRH
jgi:hypothetical protein